MKNDFSDEMIRESYGEIIEGLLLNSDYCNEKYVISLIRTILECGVNTFDLDKIGYICMKFIDLKTVANRGVNFSNNKTIVEEAIRLYNEKFGSNFDDLHDEILDETIDSYRSHSR